MTGGTIEFAVLGLISSQPEGIHGYRLKSELEDHFGDLWPVNLGRMYRILAHLESDRLVAFTEIPQIGRPPRKVYRITDRGRKALQEWLVLPPRHASRPLHDDLAVKLLLRAGQRSTDGLDLVRQHRALCLEYLSRLKKRRARLERTCRSVVGTRVLLLQTMRLRADLAWLDVVERELDGDADAAPSAQMVADPAGMAHAAARSGRGGGS